MRVTVSLGIKHYYREVHIVGREHLQHNGPQIFLSNHPCTVMDPLNVVRLSRQQSFFLVNYSMFKTPITNWIFRTFYCIPIKRREDVEASQAINNQEGFEQCNAFLQGGGTLYIAPEGNSFMDWKLRPFKTGTARIAFSAMLGNDLPFHIVPTGLTYFDGHLFRGNLHIHIGKPIDVRPFFVSYLTEPQKAVESLTDYIHAQMLPLLVDTTDKAQELVLYHGDKLEQSQQPLVIATRYQRLRVWADRLKSLEVSTPDEYQKLTEIAANFGKTLKINGISHHNIINETKLLHQVIGAVLLLILSPLSLYGWLQHIFAVGLPMLGIRLTKPYIGYDAAFKFGMGYFTVPLFYALQAGLVWHFSGNGWIGLLYLVTLPVFGFFADWHTSAIRRWFQNNRWMILQRRDPNLSNFLQQQANTIISFCHGKD